MRKSWFATCRGLEVSTLAITNLARNFERTHSLTDFHDDASKNELSRPRRKPCCGDPLYVAERGGASFSLGPRCHRDPRAEVGVRFHNKISRFG